MFKLKFSLIVILLSITSSIGYADTLRVGILNFPPYYILESNDKVMGGFLLDALEKMLKRAKIEYTVQGFPAKRLYTNVGDGTIQLWMGTLNVPEYEGKVLISPKPTFEIILELYSVTKKNIPKSLTDLKNTSIILLRGYSYAGAALKLDDPTLNIKKNLTNSHDSSFDMLVAGRAEYLLDYKQPAMETISRKRISGVNSQTLETVPIYILINKETPNAQEIMDRLMKSYFELKKIGAI